jgi:hypothetical protein
MGMADSKRKVVLLKGEEDKWYEQAIFIMRAHVDENEIDFVKEAERIINSQALHKSIAAKYESHAGFAPPATLKPALAASGAAPVENSAQNGTKKKTPRKRTKLDFILNLALLATGIALLFAFAFMII